MKWRRASKNASDTLFSLAVQLQNLWYELVYYKPVKIAQRDTLRLEIDRRGMVFLFQGEESSTKKVLTFLSLQDTPHYRQQFALAVASVGATVGDFQRAIKEVQESVPAAPNWRSRLIGAVCRRCRAARVWTKKYARGKNADRA